MILPTHNSTIFIPLFLFTFILFSSFPFSSPYKQPHLIHSNKYINNINSTTNNMKKLRRLPHVFSKVLQLPFDSDTDVIIEDKPEYLRFIIKEVDSTTLGERVFVQVVEVHNGITRVVIRKHEKVMNKDIRSQPLIHELDLNQWRFRLPSTACPELARAVFENRRLVVTVPKNSALVRGDNCMGGIKGNLGNLLVVL